LSSIALVFWPQIGQRARYRRLRWLGNAGVKYVLPQCASDVARARRNSRLPKKINNNNTLSSKAIRMPASERLVPVSADEADKCAGFVDALLLLPLALDRTYTYVRYWCAHGDLRAPPTVVEALATNCRALRKIMEEVEEYCLEKGCAVIAPGRTHLNTAVFHKFVQRAVPPLLQCILYMCALYDLLLSCAQTCRTVSGLCSVSTHPWSADTRARQQHYVRKIHAGLRNARRVAALTQRLGSDTAAILGSHALADQVRRITHVVGAAAASLQ
jgi:hypothetical protein